MTGTLDRYRKSALKFQASTCQTTWQDLSLLIDKLQKEVWIFVVNISDASFLERQYFLLLCFDLIRLDAVGPITGDFAII